MLRGGSIVKKYGLTDIPFTQLSADRWENLGHRLKHIFQIKQEDKMGGEVFRIDRMQFTQLTGKRWES